MSASTMIELPISLLFNFNHDRPKPCPSLMVDPDEDGRVPECTCKKALRRFDSEKPVISDGIFGLRITCRSHSSVALVVKEYQTKVKETAVNHYSLHSVGSLARMLALRCECEKAPPSSSAVMHLLRPFPTAVKIKLSSKTATDISRGVNQNLADQTKTGLKSFQGKGGKSLAGYVYLLSSAEIPGHFKIGFSTVNPHVRHHNMSQCYKDAVLLAYTNLVPYASHVERLVHAELLMQRRKEDCAKCGTEHKEWFELSEELAVQIVRRWAVWMAKKPYSKSSGILEHRWERRLQSISKLTPAVDHYLSRGPTWQDWIDGDGVTAEELDSRLIEIIRPDNNKESRFRKS